MHVSFDHQLENFGVDTEALKKPTNTRVFRAWLEDWEKECRKKNDPVAEATLLQKYKNLVFRDPDHSNKTYRVYDENLEWRSGRGGGWHPIGVAEDEEDEAFDLELLIEMIADTSQVEGVDIIRRENTPEEV